MTILPCVQVELNKLKPEYIKKRWFCYAAGDRRAFAVAIRASRTRYLIIGVDW